MNNREYYKNVSFIERNLVVVSYNGTDFLPFLESLLNHFISVNAAKQCQTCLINYQVYSIGNHAQEEKNALNNFAYNENIYQQEHNKLKTIHSSSKKKNNNNNLES